MITGNMYAVIRQQLKNLQLAIKECIGNENKCEQYKDLFTNDFSFWLFKQFINELKENVLFDDFISDSKHNNAFLFANRYLFGVNDDEKIFCIFGVLPTSVNTVYRNFGYTHDIVDGVFLLQFVDNRFKVKVVKTLLPDDLGVVRISGDLLMSINSQSQLVSNFYDIFRCYVQQLIANEFAKFGIITMENWHISYPKMIDGNFEKHFVTLIKIFRNILHSCGLNIIDEKTSDSKYVATFNFAGIDWVAELEYSKYTISYSITPTISPEWVCSSSQFSTTNLVQSILKFIGIDATEQIITAHLGNHKIIIHGFNLPIIKIGTHVFALNQFIAKQVILEHPEHHTVEVTFDDYYLVNFGLAQMPHHHRLARNEYMCEKLNGNNKSKKKSTK